MTMYLLRVKYVYFLAHLQVVAGIVSAPSSTLLVTYPAGQHLDGLECAEAGLGPGDHGI